jgi:AraC-like DNA-binding protein
VFSLRSRITAAEDSGHPVDLKSHEAARRRTAGCACTQAGPRKRDGPTRKRLPTAYPLTTPYPLNAYDFARQLKLAAGLPPNQDVLARRVERAQQFLQRNRDRFLAELAARAGLSDQSQLTRHFKRLVGVTPGLFRKPARIANKGQFPPRYGRASPLPFPTSR